MSNRQKEEFAKFCMDVAKLSLGSWVFGLFATEFGIVQLLLGLVGLTFSMLFFILGMKLFKEVK